MDLSHGLGYAIMIAQVILLDLALGADNSAIIGMAAKNLDHKLRKKAILIGTAGAVIARFVLAVVATYLMQIPFLKTVGAVILLWIGMGLISGEDDGEKEIKSSQTLGGAIRTIILADVIMSLDNVLAIVGATDGHMGMLAFGICSDYCIRKYAGSEADGSIPRGYLCSGYGYRLGGWRHDCNRCIPWTGGWFQASSGSGADIPDSCCRVRAEENAQTCPGTDKSVR